MAEAVDNKTRSSSLGLPPTKPASNGTMIDRLKKSNLSNVNPIIGGPLQSQKTLPKMGTSIQFKTKESSVKFAASATKPALANSKIPKYVKKTIKFQGVEDSEPGL